MWVKDRYVRHRTGRTEDHDGFEKAMKDKSEVLFLFLLARTFDAGLSGIGG